MTATQPEQFVTAATIDGHQSGFRTFMATCFWVWGVLGLLINAVIFFGMPDRVGVGTSAYVAAAILLWIGGMVMFGLGALIASSNYQFRRPSRP